DTTSFASPADLAAYLQGKINDALVAAGLTPGLMATSVLSDGQTNDVTTEQVPFGAPVFLPQGMHLHDAQTIGLPDNPTNGAVQAIVTHPTDADIMWIGLPNGGIFRTTNAQAGIGVVAWQPLLDIGPAMSISTLTLDPTAAIGATTAAGAVLVAGVGDVSNFGELGSAQTGLYRSADGGDSWRQIGRSELAQQHVRGVAARGNVIVV